MPSKPSSVDKISHFLKEGLWLMPLESLTRFRRWMIRFIRVLFLTIQKFSTDRCNSRASALTYYTVLSIVPLLAIAFGIAQRLGLELYLSDMIRQSFSASPSIGDRLIAFSEPLLARTQGGLVAAVGFSLLLWSFVTMLIQFEQALNDIWNVKQNRKPWLRGISYLAVILFGPALLAISSAATVYVSTSVSQWDWQPLGTAVEFLFRCSRFLFMWMGLILVYILLPKRSIPFRFACVGGILAGTAFQILQYYYFNFQMQISSYNVIYGSFAALPLLLIWVRLSWYLVLWGAELAYAMEEEERRHQLSVDDVVS